MASNVTCLPPMKVTSNGIFQGDYPLDYALPLAILQICLVLFVSRSLAFLLKPMKQPRVIAEIIGGILLGPSALGRSETFLHAVFPARSLTVLDTLASIGLLLFLFLVGIELDPISLRQTGKKALAIAVAGITIPFALGIGDSFVLRQTISKGVDRAPFLVFMGVALSITAFPVLVRILAELKLLTTDVGKMALSAAAVNDVAAWILLALAVALSSKGHSPLMSLYVLLSGFGFIASAVLILRPVFSWMVKRCPEGEPIDGICICVSLAIALGAGFVTDAIGIHAIFGGFVAGVIVPKEGHFAGALVEKVEDLVSGLFLPLYFASSGLKTDITTIQGLQSWALLVLVIATGCIGKIAGTVAVSLACRIPIREALTLGFLMNSKGLVELIVLNIGKERKVLNDQTFAIMVLMALFTSFVTTPLVMAVYSPARRAKKGDYMHRTIQRQNTKTQLRILACFHSSSSIPTLINLFEASRGFKRQESLQVYAMHLMELSERSSAILMVNKARKNGMPFSSKLRSSVKYHVVVAFESFQNLGNVSIRQMKAISAMSNMHEDICTSAGNKQVAMAILPYHKQQRLDGALETTREDFRVVNQKVLEHAPCSVGILVDRGLGGNTHVPASQCSLTVVVLYVGGRDDCEALAYGARMAEHPGIKLKVIHFVMDPAAVEACVIIDVENTDGPADALLAEFQHNESIQYQDRVVRNAAEIVCILQEFSRCNLFLVGRNPYGLVASVFSETNHSPDLGPVGSLLTSPEFSTTASVLVVQQHHSSSNNKSTQE